MRELFLITMASSLLLAAGLATESQNIDNVVILLDASGSMNEPMGNVRKIEAAKTAMKEVVKTLPQTIQVGLLVFSASNVKDWAYPLGPRDDKRLEAAIDLPEPSASTPLGTFMKIAADRLLQARKEQYGYGTYRLIIVTDGEANSEPNNRVDLYTRDIIQRGIIVDVIGVKMSSAHTLANKVHSYRSAADPAALGKAITEVFAEVSRPKDDRIEEDAFSMIQPIPNEIASAVVAALASSGNQPIGEMSAAAPQAPDLSVPAAAQQTAGKGNKKSGRFFGPGWILVGVCVIFVIRYMRKRR